MASLSLISCSQIYGVLPTSDCLQCSSLPALTCAIWNPVNSRRRASKLGYVGRAKISCNLMLPEAESWTSLLPHLRTHCWLLPPLAFIPLLLSIQQASRLGENQPNEVLGSASISAWLGCLGSRVREFLRDSWRMHGARKGVAQLLTVLVLANAFYSDIAPPNANDTFENVPKDLSGGDKRRKIQRPKSRNAEGCTQKCLGTCIRGGAGSPGEGPFNVRRPLVVFKEGFRSRQYCLIECSEICNLIGDGDSGP